MTILPGNSLSKTLDGLDLCRNEFAVKKSAEFFTKTLEYIINSVSALLYIDINAGEQIENVYYSRPFQHLSKYF